MEEQYKVFGYRWVILAAIVPMILCTEMFWLTFAPISSVAERYYGVGSFEISMFSTCYMIMYIIFTLPASWVIDRYGYRQSLTIGAIITAVFGAGRMLFAESFTIVLLCQFMIAIGQPFLLNISTKVPANWFPVRERSIASGILTMAQYLGFVAAMIVSPILVQHNGIPLVFQVYAIIGCICCMIAIAFTRERPRMAPGPEAEKEDISLTSMRKLFHNRNFIHVLIIVFISMGIFNTLLTLIEPILKPRGVAMEEAGMIGAVFVVAGVFGAVILPIISDKLRLRTPLFIIAIALLVPLYLGLTYLRGVEVLMLVSALAGFTVMGVAPILFQHGAEVAYPVKEGTSFGLILLMGQISGSLFVVLYEVISKASGSIVQLPMLVIVAATLLEVPITLRMKESKILLGSRKS